MLIHNIRLGLSTNSSSTHSIIILPNNKNLPNDDQLEDGHFGWQFFTAASDGGKKLYLASILFQSMEGLVGAAVAHAVVESWLGVTLKGDGTGKSFRPDGYVDHQSRIDLPLDWEGKAVSKEFFDDFKAYMLQEEVVILGGNDNEETKHPLYDESIETHLNLPIETGNKNMVCKKDSDHWVIFNRSTGMKIRMSFNPKAQPYIKASTPELVDIKLTDYCPFNCAYCYQASTTKGQHADIGAIKTITEALGDMEVFEVALGGGEPTLHPDFVSILKDFRKHNIVPNFTTKSTHWLEKDELRIPIAEYAGSFAYSAENAEAVNKVAELTSKHNLKDRLVIHYIMGIGDGQTFKEVVEACHNHHLEITLLGYKTNGRGSLFNPKDNGKWLEHLLKLKKEWKCPKIGIDTKLAQIAGEELKQAGIPHQLYHTNEGKFSMYIDAVEGLIAPSSYCEKKDMIPLFLEQYKSSEIIKEHFAGF